MFKIKDLKGKTFRAKRIVTGFANITERQEWVTDITQQLQAQGASPKIVDDRVEASNGQFWTIPRFRHEESGTISITSSGACRFRNQAGKSYGSVYIKADILRDDVIIPSRGVEYILLEQINNKKENTK